MQGEHVWWRDCVLGGQLVVEMSGQLDVLLVELALPVQGLCAVAQCQPDGVDGLQDEQQQQSWQSFWGKGHAQTREVETHQEWLMH